MGVSDSSRYQSYTQHKPENAACKGVLMEHQHAQKPSLGLPKVLVSPSTVYVQQLPCSIGNQSSAI